MPLALRHSDALAFRGRSPWVAVGQAAIMLGVSAGHLRRECAAMLEQSGMARRESGQWFVHHDFDLRLKGIESSDDRDRRQLAEAANRGVLRKYLDMAEARRDIVRGVAEYGAAGCTSQRKRREVYIAHLIAIGRLRQDGITKLSVSQLYAWEAGYAAAGISSLIPNYGHNSKSTTGGGDGGNVGPTFGPAAWHYFESLMLAGNGFSVTQSWRMTQGEASRHPGDATWTWPAIRSVQLKWRAQPRPVKLLANVGVRAFNAQCMPKGQRDYESIPAGDFWVGDERTFDIMVRVRDARRGWRATRGVKITNWLDIRSRYITGYVIADYANSNTILGALKRGIIQFGKPRKLLVDWGEDYRKAMGHIHTRREIDDFDGVRVGGVIDKLGIEVSCATPYTPWAKPIESFYARMKEDFDRLMLSFWGGRPSERHEDRAEYVRKNLHRLPTIEDIDRFFAASLAVYHNRSHGGDGMFQLTPAEAIVQFREGPIRAETPLVLDHYFSEFIGPRQVRRDGIRWLNGWYGHGEAQLLAMLGQRVYLSVQPDDISHAQVCDLAQRPIDGLVVTCNAHRFSTKRDAEKLARMRALLRRPYVQRAREARGWYEDQNLGKLLDNLHRGSTVAGAPALPDGTCGTGFQPVGLPESPPLRLVAARPQLETALRESARRQGRIDARPEAPRITVELEDMLDPLTEAPPPAALPADADDADDGDYYGVEL